jgi:hypothetical protein
LCWADLRPPPPPPAPVAPPVPVAAPALTLVAAPAVDPLTAPLATVLGEPAPEPEVAATWPCVQCGAANGLDLDTCAICTTPFGGRIARIGDVKEHRRKVLFVGLGAMAAFLLVLAALTFATTTTKPATPANQVTQVP